MYFSGRHEINLPFEMKEKKVFFFSLLHEAMRNLQKVCE